MKAIYLVVLLGLGVICVAWASDFSFSSPIRLTLDRNSVGNVAIGDANGDGRKDLAVTSRLENFDHQLSLFLQRADGSLSPPVNVLLPNDIAAIYPVAFADLDRNGTEEIIVGSAHSGMTVVRLGALGELSATHHPSRRGCAFLVTGDLDSDGKTDVVCHDWKSTATLYYGDGIGGISSKSELRMSSGAYSADFKSLQLADVTGDGHPDLIVTATSINSFFVHPNNGSGGFWPATVYTHPWTPARVWPAAVQVLDLDGDGVMEVVTASPDSQPGAVLNIYRRDERGYLALSEQVDIHDGTTALLADDVDGDGHTDLLAGHFGFNTLSFIRGKSGGTASQERFELPGFGNLMIPSWSGGHSNSIALGDLDGDGCKDLASATYSGVLVLYGCEPFASRVPVSDFDGDGVSDLLWRYEGTGENSLWQWADLAAWYGCALPCIYPMGSSWTAQAVGDFSGNGTSGVFWRNRETGANQIRYLRFQSVELTGVISQDWQVVGVGDFDGDDRSDLLWRNMRTGANTIWRSGDSGTVQRMDAVADLGWKVVGVGDFDGDGRSDILWRHAGSGRNAIWLAGKKASQLAIAGVGNLSWKVAGVGDFNGDGRDDVVWRNTTTGANTIWLSADAATRQTVRGVTNLAWVIGAVGDYNGDGYADLVWRNVATGENVIWRSGDAARQQAVARTDAGMRLIR